MSPLRVRALAGLAGLGVTIAVLALVLLPSDGADSERPRDESTFLRLLALIPDRAETRFDVSLVDYNRLFAALDVTRPQVGQTAAENDKLWSDLSAGARVHGFTLALGYAANLGILSDWGAYSQALPTPDALGYGLGEIGGYVVAGRDPNGYEAVVGQFDSGRVTQRISHCPECGIEAVAQTYAGTTYYAWGDDFQPHLLKRLQAPAFDALGVGGRLTASSGM